MAYFANGTAGMDYQARYCDKCANADDNGMCAIWDAHLIYSYGAEGEMENILNLLIPEKENGFADQCNLFRKIP